MKYLVCRNHTVEHLFRHLGAHYNGYGDLSVSTDGYDITIWYFALLPGSDTGKAIEEVRSYSEQLEYFVNSNSEVRIVILSLSERLNFRFLDEEHRLSHEVARYNQAAQELALEKAHVQYISIDEFLNNYSIDQIFNWKYFLMSQTLMAPTLAKHFKRWFNEKLQSLDNKRKKCIVLDLDNTLWGGVLGEEGVENIQVGDSYPGLAFRTFQEQLLEAQKNGVLLSVCSKNNLEDVEEAWKDNPFLVLRASHFAAIRVNWNNKASNIQEIAAELNIGLDSMVFIDDNPTEREIVRQTLPEVTVPDFPKEPFQLPGFFQEVWNSHFKVYELTKEDKQKTRQYLENRQRVELKTKLVDFEQYLRSLEIVLYPKMVDEFSIVRAAQMTQKTNQFNLRTQRYTVQHIRDFLDQGHLVCQMSVKDKFGDSGITLLTIALIDGKKAFLDTFLLSCRILGKKIEREFMHYLINQLSLKGVEEITAEFIPSKKNQQTKDFYEAVGFEPLKETPEGTKTYKRTVNGQVELNDIYSIEL